MSAFLPQVAALCLLLSACCSLPYAYSQDQPSTPSPATMPMAQEEEKPLPGDWAVELLDKLANSPNAEASDELY